MIKWPQNIKTPLNSTEYKAMQYLLSKGIVVDTTKFKKNGQPDFVDLEGNEYEIKRITNTANKLKRIFFNQLQVKNFKDNVKVLIFEPFENKPKIETMMGNIKIAIKSKRGYKNIDGIQIITI